METTLTLNKTMHEKTFPRLFYHLTLKSVHKLSPLPATLYCFEPSGYLIRFGNDIIEYSLNTILSIKSGDILKYFGPLQLFSGNQPVKRTRQPNHLNENDWIGIESDKFKLYQSWINRDGTCGMLAATVLLAYYQDHIEINTVHRRLREPFSSDYEKLYQVMMNYVKTLMIQGTIAPDLAIGLNRYFKDYGVNARLPYEFKARFKMATTFGVMKPLLEANIPKPGIIGLFRWLGSPKNYRNHWVVAYAYRKENNQTFYQVHDNHGLYDAVVNVRWTSSVVRLSRKLKEEAN